MSPSWIYPSFSTPRPEFTPAERALFTSCLHPARPPLSSRSSSSTTATPYYPGATSPSSSTTATPYYAGATTSSSSPPSYRPFLVPPTPFAPQPIGQIKRACKVTEALNTTRALADPGYAYAVLESYASTKLAMGRTKYQVQHKLACIERKMPHFAADFHALRRELGLPPSRSLPPAPPPPYTKECSCECTCGALPGGTVGAAMARGTSAASSLVLGSPPASPTLTNSPGPHTPSRPFASASPTSDTGLSRATSASVGSVPAQQAPRPYWISLGRHRSLSGSTSASTSAA